MSPASKAFRLPIVDPRSIREVAAGVWIIADDDRTPLVPNIGIIVGQRATLIIDTGLGADNARTVLKEARRISNGNPLFLTHTHCHPEHGFGANIVADEVTTISNAAQWVELKEKGHALLQMFRKQIPAVAPMLADVEFLKPSIGYSEFMQLDLGGLVVEFHEFGGGHSRGDQVLMVRGNLSVQFTGDLVEDGYFGILGDHESHVVPWIDRLDRLERLAPDIVVPGHGHTGGRELITTFRGYLDLARRRVRELRDEDTLTEAQIVERVGAELLALHPDWENRHWAALTAADLAWPGRT